MRNHIKIIFFDIDGTLIDMERKVISERTVETLCRLQENGIKICVATGRPPISLPDFHGARFDAFLTFNGSFCYTEDKVIYRNPIPNEDVHLIINNAAAIHRPVSIATAKRMSANGKDQDLIDYYAISRQEVTVSDDFAQLADQEIYQIMMGCYPEEYPKVMKNVRHAKIAAWWDRAVDIIPASGGKGIGVQKILEHFQLSPDEAAAFGDGDNDIEMLQAVGTGIAMANASANLKQAADVLCKDVREDGVYMYCKENGLI